MVSEAKKLPPLQFNIADMVKTQEGVEPFSELDCSRVCMMHSQKANAPKNILYEVHPTDDLKVALNRAYINYRISLNPNDKNAPSVKKLQSEYSSAYSSAKKLYQKLLKANKKEDVYFWGGLMAAKSKGLDQLNDDGFKELANDVAQKGNDLIASLEWFLNNMEACLAHDFDFEWCKLNPHNRKQPETGFIQELSNILTGYLGDGGYTRNDYCDPNSATGWRIDCLEYLLKRAGVQKSRNQILDAVASS